MSLEENKTLTTKDTGIESDTPEGIMEQLELFSFRHTRHSDQDVIDFEMDRNCSVYIDVKPFNLVVNYDEEDFKEVNEKAIATLKAFHKELGEQIAKL